jgi:glutamate-1-semialdehyde 2,1-aminomutase
MHGPGHNKPKFQNSEDWLDRAERSIPLGSQTFSKSKTQLPIGISPLFAERGEGSRLIDIDGNSFIDYVCSLGAITLGYNDPDVNKAVIDQAQKAVIMSLAGREETYLAERIIDLIPCAERVRFGKNGSDATAGCVRLARAHTKRDLVAVCGYHGWQDWYIGSTPRNLGVPASTSALTKKFTYNDIDSVAALFKAHPGEIAALVLEPLAFEEPRNDFLAELKAIAHKNGALLVFDEVVTGFRFPGGSAQAMTGVTPDLAAIGKGMANGFPVSAVVGREEVMRLMEEVFFSFTMGGELVSIAAACATIDKMKTHHVNESVARVGKILLEGVRALITRHGIGDILSIAGHPSWQLLIFKDAPTATSFEIKTYYMQEAMRRGILAIGIHFLSYAHSEEDVAQTLGVYDEIFAMLADGVAKGTLRQQLDCNPLVPLFKVR